MQPEQNEAVTEVIPIPGGWMEKNVYPPDEDTAAREARWLDEKRRTAVAERGPKWADTGWRRVADIVSGVATGMVLGGPWPIRVFVVEDGTMDSVGETELWRCLGALMTTGEAWTMRTNRRGDKREFLVTWGWAFLLDAEVLADELAAMYDES